MGRALPLCCLALAVCAPRQDAPTVDAATRNTVIEAAIASLAEYYVFPDTAKKMADAVRDRRARGDYDSVTDGAEFARLLTEHFQAVSHDRHLRVSFDASGFSAGHDGAPSIEEQTRVRRELVSTNCGFNKAERLDGNIGYLEFRFFGPVDDCGETASAAMSFLVLTCLTRRRTSMTSGSDGRTRRASSGRKRRFPASASVAASQCMC
jgi:hypothetical protein